MKRFSGWDIKGNHFTEKQFNNSYLKNGYKVKLIKEYTYNEYLLDFIQNKMEELK